MSVYENCPVLQDQRFLLRMVQREDLDDLLKVYSDPDAVPLFNSDNCHGDDFCYRTRERMAQAIDFWLFSYEHRYFVRWSVIDRRTEEAVGTVEVFRREAEDAFTDTALLRLDLRSDYEKAEVLESILSMMIDSACELFSCSTIATKAVPQARVRRDTLCRMGFQESSEMLKGHDGTEYRYYFVRSIYA